MRLEVLSAFAFGGAGLIGASGVRARLERWRAHRAARRQVGLVQRPGPSPRESTGRLAVLGRPVRRRREIKRAEQLSMQLAPALQLIVGHLRIGRSFTSALTDVTDSSPEPLRSLLTEVVAETRLGAPVDDVLRDIADREGGRHLSIVASAIGLQARLGGSLTEILETVIDTIEEEDRLRRDIRSLTADGRLSAQILLAMPPIMFVLVSLLSPGYAEPLFTDPLGRLMLGIAVLLALVGWRWLRSLSHPRVVA